MTIRNRHTPTTVTSIHLTMTSRNRHTPTTFNYPYRHSLTNEHCSSRVSREQNWGKKTRIWRCDRARPKLGFHRGGEVPHLVLHRDCIPSCSLKLSQKYSSPSLRPSQSLKLTSDPLLVPTNLVTFWFLRLSLRPSLGTHPPSTSSTPEPGSLHLEVFTRLRGSWVRSLFCVSTRQLSSVWGPLSSGR
jgi:hypothetical protein